MTSQFLEQLQSTHLAIWNEKDTTHRSSLMKSIYADDIKMFDKDFILSGIDEISGFITKLLTEDPEFSFTATKQIQATQNGGRLFWNIKTGGNVLPGMDFFKIENSKVKEIYVFMD